MDKQNERLTSFSTAYKKMIAINENAYGISKYSERNFREKIKNYSIEEVERIINSGSLHEQISLSRNYFLKDGFYNRIILHYATLLKYTGIVIPNPSFGKSLSEPYIEKKYYNATNFVDKANLNSLFIDIAVKALRDGTYYGILLSVSNDSIAILELPVYYCRSRFKDEEGNNLIEFNVTFFDKIYDVDDRNAALKLYPKEVVNHYRRYKKGKVKSVWVFIPAEMGICMPFFDGRPMFLNIIPAAIDYDQAKDVNRERDLEEIRKILVQHIPHLADGGLLFEPDEAEVMHKGAVQMMDGNKNISVLTTYADVDAIVSKTSNDNANNSVEKSLTNIYATAGVSGLLFGTESNLSLETSINNDTALMMSFAYKLSRFITFILNKKFSNSNISFRYKILPITYYNKDKYLENALKAANSGYSFLLPALSMDISQKELNDLKDLENDVLKLKDKLIPLSTSYTESGKVGRPEKSLEEKSEKTIANEESLDNGGTTVNG